MVALPLKCQAGWLFITTRWCCSSHLDWAIESGRLSQVVLDVPDMELALAAFHLTKQGARWLAQQVAEEAETAPVRHAHLHALHPVLSTPLHQRNHAWHQSLQSLQTKALQQPQSQESAAFSMSTLESHSCCYASGTSRSTDASIQESCQLQECFPLSDWQMPDVHWGFHASHLPP